MTLKLLYYQQGSTMVYNLMGVGSTERGKRKIGKIKRKKQHELVSLTNHVNITTELFFRLSFYLNSSCQMAKPTPHTNNSNHPTNRRRKKVNLFLCVLSNLFFDVKFFFTLSQALVLCAFIFFTTFLALPWTFISAWRKLTLSLNESAVKSKIYGR